MSANVVWQRILQFFPEVIKGPSGAAPAVDWTKGSVQSITLNAATVTPTFVAPPGGCNLALVVTQDGVGGRAVTWPASVSWIGGTPPILLSGAGQTTLLNFYFDGTTYFGSLATAGSPSSLIPWTAVAAGTALAASLARPNLAADSSGAQSTITLPTAAQMAAADGFLFTIKATGTMLSPVIVTAGAGTTVELLNAPGTFGASTWLPIQGQSLFLKYDKATTQWKAWATASASGLAGLPAFNAGWFLNADIGWDPGNVSGLALDSNPGTVAAPVRHFFELVRRWGSRSPTAQPNQKTVLHVMSPQPAGDAIADPIGVFQPNAPIGMFAIIGTLQSAGADFAAGAITQIVRTAGGNDFQVAGVPGYVVAGTILQDTTIVAGSYCVVVSVNAGTATCTNPHTAGPLTTPINNPVPVQNGASWTIGDNIKAWTPPTIFADAIIPAVGTTAAFGGANTSGMVWLQNLNYGDPANVAGTSNVTIRPVGPFAMMLCTATCAVTLDGVDTIFGGNFAGHYNSTVAACSFMNGGEFGGDFTQLFGCFINNTPASTSTIRDRLTLKTDTIVNGGVIVIGLVNVFNVHFSGGGAGLVQVEPGASLVMRAPTNAGCVWGATTIRVAENAAMINRTGSTWTLQCLVTTLQVNFATPITTASAYVGAGVWTDGITITSPNIDTGAAFGPGLRDVRTGACYVN